MLLQKVMCIGTFFFGNASCDILAAPLQAKEAKFRLDTGVLGPKAPKRSGGGKGWNNPKPPGY
jgi:hypothetical protein